MRKPHITAIIDSLGEPWFIGSPLGPKYGVLLIDALARRHDGDALERSLALGDYNLHTSSNKRQRMALRAVLLASFLMKRQPLSLRDTLCDKYGDKDVPFLIREFKHLFPAIYDANRDSWAPSHFTNPETLTPYLKPNNWSTGAVPRHKFIVHGVRFRDRSKVISAPIDILSKWLCISMSVLSDTKTASFSNHGLILEVPATNILTTSPVDQWFDNFAGTERSVKAPGVSLSAHIIDKNLRIGGLLTPTQVVERQGTPAAQQNYAGEVMTKYNEIVVCGIPGLLMPFGGKTSKLQLLGMFIQTRMNGTLPERWFNGSQGNPREVEKEAQEFTRRHRVPLLYLPTRDLT